MKKRILVLLQRPSSWVTLLAASLIVLVVLSPELKKQPVAPIEVASSPLLPAPEVIESAAPMVAAPTTPLPAPPEAPVAEPPVVEPSPAPPQPLPWIAFGPSSPPDLTAEWVGNFRSPTVPAEWGAPDSLNTDLAEYEPPPEPPAQLLVAKTEPPPTAVSPSTVPEKPTTRIAPPPPPPPPVVVAENPVPPEKTKTPEPTPPPLSEEPLPPSQGDVWKVVKIDGRDYVTGQSMQLFYRFSTHKLDGNHVWFRNPNLILKAQVGSQEMLVNNIKFILSYPVLNHNGQAMFSRLDLCKLIEPVIRPSYINSGALFDTVVLDAGHGGHDSGAKGVYGYEKTYALAMALTVRDSLIKRGFKVVMTRTTDTFLSLSSRVGLANKTPNSIFISLHFNSGGTAASGIETFALTPQGSASSLARGGGFSNSARTGNQFDSENIALATAVHAQVVHRFKLIDRGIKRARWTILTGCNRPGILFEGGFVTNARECQLIASENYRKAVSEAIGDAVVNYRKALAPKPVSR